MSNIEISDLEKCNHESSCFCEYGFIVCCWDEMTEAQGRSKKQVHGGN